MTAPSTGITTLALGPVTWIKAKASNSQGQCVELAQLRTGDVAIRDSKDPHGPALVFTRAELAAFLNGARGGEFDHLT